MSKYLSIFMAVCFCFVGVASSEAKPKKEKKTSAAAAAVNKENSRGSGKGWEVVLPRPEPAKKPVKVEKDNSLLRGDWSLSLSGFGLGVDGGSALYGLEGQFLGDLRMSENWFFHFQAGPGLGWVDGETLFTLSEFVGVAYRFSAVEVALGGRHRVAFQNGDMRNAILGEGQLRFRLSESFMLSLFGGFGSAWFPQTGSADGFYPAGFTPPDETEAKTGKAWEAGGALEFRF